MSTLTQSPTHRSPHQLAAALAAAVLAVTSLSLVAGVPADDGALVPQAGKKYGP